MERSEFNSHVSERYNNSLEELFNQVLEMGGLVEKQLSSTHEAITVENKPLAKEVKQLDKLVNKEEIEIDALCAKVLATQQPTARDLRLVVSAIRIAVDLERAGDETVNVAKLAIVMAGMNEVPTQTLAGFEQINKMLIICQDMLNKTLKCFSELSTEYCLEVPEDKTRVVQLAKEAQLEVNKILKGTEDVTVDCEMQMLYTVRSAERIAAHIVNITESIIYLIHGRNVSHMNSERLAEFLKGEL